MTAKVELRLLGRPAIFVDGRQVTGFRSDKARALLWYLAATQRPHSRTALAGLLWGDWPESRARRSLTTTLSNLRQLVGDLVMSDRQEIEFKPPDGYWADINILAAAPLTARTEADIRQLATAIDCYAGEFLAGFYVQGAPEFEQWVEAERVRYREMAVEILLTLANHYEKHAFSPTKWVRIFKPSQSSKLASWNAGEPSGPPPHAEALGNIIMPPI